MRMRFVPTSRATVTTSRPYRMNAASRSVLGFLLRTIMVVVEVVVDDGGMQGEVVRSIIPRLRQENATGGTVAQLRR